MRKFSMMLVVCAVLLVSSYALASVHGEWNVDRSEKWSLKIGKANPTIETHTVVDVWRFRDDNSFLSSTFSGWWKQKGARFDVYVDEAQVATFIQNQFLANGVPVSAALKKLRIYGSEKNIYGAKNREWMIKGKYEIKADVVFPDLSIGKLDIKGDFMGTMPYETAEYFPLGQGDTWTTKETYSEDGEIGEDTETLLIAGTEKIKGVLAVKRVEVDDNPAEVDYSLWTNVGGIKFYKDYDIDFDDDVPNEEIETYNPPLMYLPARISIGTRYAFKTTMTYKRIPGPTVSVKISGNAIIEGLDNIEVPAGRFVDCIRVKFFIDSSIKKMNFIRYQETTVWLAKGVGVVYEEGYEISNGNGEISESVWVKQLLSATVGGVSYP